jgi:hypothetical protein
MLVVDRKKRYSSKKLMKLAEERQPLAINQVFKSNISISNFEINDF